MYRASNALDENDSVSPAITHNITKAYQYQVVKTRFAKFKFRGTFSAPDSGIRAMAMARSSEVKYGAFVVVGVSGNSKNP